MGGSRLRVASLIATFVILAVPGSALAHAELQRSIPDNGETVTDPVTVVTGTDCVMRSHHSMSSAVLKRGSNGWNAPCSIVT